MKPTERRQKTFGQILENKFLSLPENPGLEVIVSEIMHGQEESSFAADCEPKETIKEEKMPALKKLNLTEKDFDDDNELMQLCRKTINRKTKGAAHQITLYVPIDMYHDIQMLAMKYRVANQGDLILLAIKRLVRSELKKRKGSAG